MIEEQWEENLLKIIWSVDESELKLNERTKKTHIKNKIISDQNYSQNIIKK